jgi:hypothetical protein
VACCDAHHMILVLPHGRHKKFCMVDCPLILNIKEIMSNVLVWCSLMRIHNLWYLMSHILFVKCLNMYGNLKVLCLLITNMILFVNISNSFEKKMILNMPLSIALGYFKTWILHVNKQGKISLRITMTSVECSQFRATSHKRLRAHVYYTSSTLIGRKSRSNPSLLHTLLEGPTKYVNARWMWCLHGSLHGIEWITFHGHLDYFPKPPLGGRPNTKPGDHLTPNSHNRWFILFYHAWRRHK